MGESLKLLSNSSMNLVCMIWRIWKVCGDMHRSHGLRWGTVAWPVLQAPSHSLSEPFRAATVTRIALVVGGRGCLRGMLQLQYALCPLHPPPTVAGHPVPPSGYASARAWTCRLLWTAGGVQLSQKLLASIPGTDCNSLLSSRCNSKTCFLRYCVGWISQQVDTDRSVALLDRHWVFHQQQWPTAPHPTEAGGRHHCAGLWFDWTLQGEKIFFFPGWEKWQPEQLLRRPIVSGAWKPPEETWRSGQDRV